MNRFDEQYVTSHEASEILGMKYDTYMKRHARGTLKFEPMGRFGSHLIWLRAEIETYARIAGN